MLFSDRKVTHCVFSTPITGKIEKCISPDCNPGIIPPELLKDFQYSLSSHHCKLQVSPQEGRRGLITGCGCTLSCFSWVLFFVTPWTVAHQSPLSVGFSRQKHWSGLPCPPPGDLPYPGTQPRSPTLQADSLPSEPAGKPTRKQCQRSDYNRDGRASEAENITLWPLIK